VRKVYAQKARVDAEGALHNRIFRGIERRRIFLDNKDRDTFVYRLGMVLTEIDTHSYGCALIPNHAHLLLKTSRIPISTAVRRLLTGGRPYPIVRRVVVAENAQEYDTDEK
jgi:putative transposase